MAEPVWTVDVWHCRARPIREQDWRRYLIAAADPAEAELIACQMAYRFGHAVRSVVIDPL